MLVDPATSARPHPATRRPRDGLAIAAGRLIGFVTRRTGHGGTSLPGMTAERVAPHLLADLGAELGGAVLVTGTNGKTTTTHLIAHILQRGGRPVIANRSGANLRQAVTTSLLSAATLGGHLTAPGAIAVLEVDEAALTSISDALTPSALVFTNLFRDQLDRYGETDALIRRWQAVLEQLPNAATVVYCADDPRIAELVASRRVTARAYGLIPPDHSTADMSLTPDVTTCPRCDSRLSYAWTVVGHLGSYGCTACGFARPPSDLAVRVVSSRGIDGQTLAFSGRDIDGEPQVTVRIPGTSNAYNAAAAVAAAMSLGVPASDAVAALEDAVSPFGRYESIDIDRRHVVLMLGKNPASLAELIRIATESEPSAVLFALNDNHADGRDVSWYWDLDPAELISGRRYAISGTRAADFRLRIKYELDHDPATPPAGEHRTSTDPAAALTSLVESVEPGRRILVIATYTALLGLRAGLVRRGLTAPPPR